MKRKLSISFLEKLIFCFLLILVIETTLRIAPIKTIYVLPFLILIGIYIIRMIYQKRSRIFSSSNSGLIFGVVGGLLMLNWANQHFWRQLIDARFFAVLLPFFGLLLARTRQTSLLSVVSLILATSGFLYAFSNGVGDNFPAPKVKEKLPLVYQDAFAYSTQFFYNSPLDTPFVTDFTPFYEDCRICKMGKDNIPFETFERMLVVWRSNSNPLEKLPSYFVLLNKEEKGLTTLDHFQFRYFNPIHKRRYAVFTYIQKN